MRSPVGKSVWSMIQGVDALLGEKYCVTGDLGELLDAGSHVDRVPDQGELQLASTANRPGDHHTGVDPDTDPKLAAEPLGYQALNQLRRAHRRIGMIREVIRRAKDSEGTVAKELVYVPTGIDDGRHDDLEKSVETGNDVLGGVRLGERGEVADV